MEAEEKGNLKVWFYAKSTVFTIAGIVVLVFSYYKEMLNILPYVVGATIGYYGIESVLLGLLKKRIHNKEGNIVEGFVFIIFSVLMMFVINDDPVKVCVLWAIWSMEREIREVEEAVKSLKNGKLGILNIIESAVIVVFCVLLLVDPNEEHIKMHILILGIELILEVAFVWMNIGYTTYREWKIKKDGEAVNSSDTIG